jgi:hypothetical protein
MPGVVAQRSRVLICVHLWPKINQNRWYPQRKIGKFEIFFTSFATTT